jgi:hypothetical protein
MAEAVRLLAERMTKTKIKRPWQNPNDVPTIGPLEVPWEIRKWVFVGGIQTFRIARQNFTIDKKRMEVVVTKVDGSEFKDANIAGGKFKGTPVLTYKDMEAIFELAEKEDISLKQAFVRMHERKIDPETLETIQAEIAAEAVAAEPESEPVKADPLQKYVKRGAKE